MGVYLSRIIYNLENIQTNLIEGNLSLKNNLLYKKDLQENYTTLLSSQINWKMITYIVILV